MNQDPRQETTSANSNKNSENGKVSSMFSWGLYTEMAMEFAVLTAAPLLLFIFLGPLLILVGLENAGDWVVRAKRDYALYNIIGVLVAITLTFFMIFRKIKALQEQLKK